MRILNWICWLRGFHRSSYTVLSADVKAESSTVWGSVGRCWICGKASPLGPQKDSVHCLEWRT
jgi:hypothetical protein